MIHVTTGPQNAQLCSYWTTRSVCKFTTPFPAQPHPNSNDCANHIVHLACQTTYEAWLIQQAKLLITFVYKFWQNFCWHQRFFRHHVYKLGTFQGMLQYLVSSPLTLQTVMLSWVSGNSYTPPTVCSKLWLWLWPDCFISFSCHCTEIQVWAFAKFRREEMVFPFKQTWARRILAIKAGKQKLKQLWPTNYYQMGEMQYSRNMSKPPKGFKCQYWLKPATHLASERERTEALLFACRRCEHDVCMNIGSKTALARVRPCSTQSGAPERAPEGFAWNSC